VDATRHCDEDWLHRPFSPTGTVAGFGCRAATVHRARSVVCHGCGLPGRTAREVADLTTPWLVPAPGPEGTSRDAGTDAGAGPGAGLVEARFCRRCAPTGPVEDVACAACGDGPLLAGDLAVPDLAAAAAIDAWLEQTGWRPAGPWCPTCAAAIHPPR